MWKHPIHLILLIAVLTLVLVGPTYGGFDPLKDPTLVGWWSFDEGTGTTAADASSYGRDGTLEGGATWAEGRFGGGIELDGTSGYISVPDFELTTDAITFVTWINGWKAGDWAPLLSSRTTTPCEMNFGDNDTLHYTWNGDSSATWGWAGGPVVPQDTWTMLAITLDPDKAVAYVYTDDGGLVQTTNAIAHVEQTVGALQIGYSYDPRYVQGVMDEAAIYARALTEAEILTLTKGPQDATLAAAPTPADEATDIPRDTDLSWIAGEFAAAHDVYFGTAFDDVNDGAETLLSEGQTAASYDPGRLEFGQTYYWRIDEVNGTPDNTIFRGKTWSFTVEPFAYPVENIIATSNGIFEAGAGPENTINGSGLNELDQHSVDAPDMFLGKPIGDDPFTIQYEFDSVYKLHEMLVWNYNVAFELMLGFGFKDTTVEYSVDGIEWTALPAVEFAQATAKPGYAANTTVAFDGVAAKYIRLTVNSSYDIGMLPEPQYGLSEIHFLYIPVQAREPQAADGDPGVSVATDLSWRAGREAASHEVSLGTDPNALASAGTVTTASYDPGTLDLETTYYWQITEVNEAEAISTWEGSLWSFTTQDFLVVDDFESYIDDEGGRIYEIWADGWVNDTGSTVGYLEAPFAETTIVNNGSQAMPLFYDNADADTSEADLTLSQNWTTNGIKSLSLYFHGAQDNTGQLYLKINGTKIVYDGDASDISKGLWQPWNIDLSAVGGNLSSVTKLTIGIEGTGAAGTLYIDDIRLYPQTPEFITPVEPDVAGLVLYYALDEGSGSVATDASGSGNNGTIEGDPAWIPGASGTALGFDGSRDYVTSGNSLLSDLTGFTIACWLKGDLSLGNRSGLVGQNDCVEYGVVSSNTVQIYTSGGGTVDLNWPYDADADWHHIVAVGDGQAITMYLDGKPAITGGAAITDTYGASTFPINIGGGGIFDATDNWFTGDVDEIYIYQRALSAAEVAGMAGLTEPIAVPF